jgi:hypothetical protein
MEEQLYSGDLRLQNWRSITDWLVSTEQQLPQVWPSELPPEGTKDFWFTVCRFEMLTRQEVSSRLRVMIRGEEMGDVRGLESWFFRRRIEWAGQVALAAIQKKIPPGDTAEDALLHLLIESWEKEGCIGLWYHAEREGHPGSPDGLSPLPAD